MDVLKLRSFLEDLVKTPELQPKADGTTFCNFAVQRVAKLFEISTLDNLMANQIVKLISNHDAWVTGKTGNQAFEWAMKGNFAVAGQTAKDHGHIATIYPAADMIASGNWGKLCPVVANVGKKNG